MTLVTRKMLQFRVTKWRSGGSTHILYAAGVGPLTMRRMEDQSHVLEFQNVRNG